MNRRLRRAHGVAAGVMAIAAPVTLAVAIVGRRPVPAFDVPLLRGGAHLAIEGEGGPTGRWRDLDASYRVGVDDRGRPLVEVTSLGPVGAPDVLVYWTSAEPTDRLPEYALLLGGFDGTGPRVFALPAAATSEPGYLVAYSLAHGEVVGVSSVVLPVSRGTKP